MAIEVIKEHKLDKDPVYYLKCRVCGSILKYNNEDLNSITGVSTIYDQAIICPVCKTANNGTNNMSEEIKIDLSKVRSRYFKTSVVVPEGVKVYIPKYDQNSNKIKLELQENLDIIPPFLGVVLEGDGEVTFNTITSNNDITYPRSDFECLRVAPINILYAVIIDNEMKSKMIKISPRDTEYQYSYIYLTELPEVEIV